MFARNLEGTGVELRLHEEATEHQYRELGLFVRDCIDRVERQLGRADSWKITIVPAAVCFNCEVIAQFGELTMQGIGAGFDAAVAGWQAFREIEDQLRLQIGTDLTAYVDTDLTARVA
jgi:hypothetical protein